MVALEFLRNKAAIFVAVIIGLALFAFVLSDLLTPGRSVFSTADMEVGHVGRTAIDYPQFQAKVDYQLQLQKALGADQSQSEALTNQTRERVWEDFVRDQVLARFGETTGLTLTSEELATYIMGDEPHAIVRQLFSNPQTGEFDKEQVVNFLHGLNDRATPEQRAYWLEMEHEIAGEQLKQKFTDLIAKAVGFPMPLVKYSAEELGNTVQSRYFSLPYSSLPDSAVKVSESACREYYARNKASYKRDERRDLSYVVFNVVPSDDDRVRTLESLEKLIPDFSSAEDAGLFATQNGDTPYRGRWMSRDEAQPTMVEWLFDEAQVNDVSTVQSDGNRFFVLRLLNRQTLPDSAHARHILFSSQRYSMDRAQQLADSVKALIAKGADFVALAQQYSDDPGSKDKGGDLDWFKPGVMVKAFNDACFNGKPGDLVVVSTQFGVHIVEVLGQKGSSTRVDVAELSMKVEPGNFTFQKQYQKASVFAVQAHTDRPGWFARLFSSSDAFSQRALDHFDSQVEADTLQKRIADGVERSWPSISGLANSREIVRWAFEAYPGQVSQVFELENSYVVAILSGVQESKNGYASFDAVRDEVVREVRREEKARLLSQRIDSMRNAGVGNLESMASGLGAQVRVADGISYQSYSFGQEGYEPAVIGVASAQEVGKISGAVRGNMGIFVVETVELQPRGTVNLDREREQRVNEWRNRVNYTAYEALVKLSDVKDNRAKFY